jgi:CheY-like chemotaxis protein
MGTKKILYVEDDKLISFLSKEKLKACFPEMDVTIAKSCGEAIDMIEKDGLPDLIISEFRFAEHRARRPSASTRRGAGDLYRQAKGRVPFYFFSTMAKDEILAEMRERRLALPPSFEGQIFPKVGRIEDVVAHYLEKYEGVPRAQEPYGKRKITPDMSPH